MLMLVPSMSYTTTEVVNVFLLTMAWSILKGRKYKFAIDYV